MTEATSTLTRAGGLACIKHRGDQHPVMQSAFAHHQFIGEGLVLITRHPGGALPGFGPRHNVIARAQGLAWPKIGAACPMLFHHDIHPGGDH
jgi:hypothetical protein